MPASLMIDQLSQIISQATAPAFLLGAVAGFVSVLIGRLNRVVDRGAALLSIDHQDSERLRQKKEIPLLQRRAKLINRAIECAVVAGICTTFLVIAAFASALIGFNHTYGSALLFVAALAFFATALIYLLLEVRIAIAQFDRIL
jgi:hypothetical protein